MTSEEIKIWVEGWDSGAWDDTAKDTQASALIEIAYQFAVMNEREAARDVDPAFKLGRKVGD